ncbi:hypothetical protein BgiBS90_037415, partial [Biomphalaria glabrata]
MVVDIFLSSSSSLSAVFSLPFIPDFCPCHPDQLSVCCGNYVAEDVRLPPPVCRNL